jgi:hypothetical protein
VLDEAVVARASEILGARFAPHEQLKGSHRWVVVRGHAGDRSVIVKHAQPDDAGAGLGYPSELAALQFFAGDDVLAGLVPPLVAFDRELQFVVLGDLGDHPTLADPLLGDDREHAHRRLCDYAELLGTFACRSHRRVDAYNLDGGHPTHFAIWKQRETIDTFGLPAAAQRETRVILDRVEHAREWYTVGPADACPDNVLITPDGLRLLDFEGASVYHALFDAAALTFPFPSCWCHNAPPQFANELVAIHRSALGEVAGDDYDEQLALVTVVFSLWVLQRWLGPTRQEEIPIPIDGVASARQRTRIAVDALRRAATGALLDWAHTLDAEVQTWGDESAPRPYRPFV